MTAAVVALLAADGRSAWNRARRGRLPGLRLAAVPSLTALLTGAALAAGVTTARTGAAPAAALGLVIDGVVALVLVRGLPRLYQRFFTDRTLLVLLTAPVHPLHVFVSRFAAACSSLSSATVWAAAYAAGFGARRGLGLALVAPTLAAAALTTIDTVAAAVAVLSVTSRLSPGRRALWAAFLLAGLAGLLTGLRDGGPWWLPLGWPVRAAVTTGDGGTPLALWALSVGSAAVLVTVAWASYRLSLRRGLPAAWGWTEPAPPAHGARPAPPGPARPVRALVHKDLLLLRRDPRSLTAVLPAAGLAAAYPLLVPSAAPAADWFWLEVTAAVFLPYLLSGIVGLPAVAAEGQRLWLLLVAGVEPWVIVRAKIAFALPCVVVLAVGAVTVLALRHGGWAGQVLAAGALAAWWSAGMAAIAVGAGAAATDARGAGRVTAAGVALNAVAAMAFGLLGVLALAGIVVAQRRPPAAGVAAAASVTSAALVGGVLWLGVRRLGTWRPR